MAAKRNPPGLTDEQQEVFLLALREGNSPEKAARAADTSRRTVNRVRQADEQFALDYDDAYESGLDMVEQVLFDVAAGREQANSARVTATCAILNARRPSFYKRMANAQQPPKPPKRRDLTDLTDDELRDLEKLLGKLDAGTPGS